MSVLHWAREEVDLDYTLGCGQVFRWYKEDGKWKGLIDNREVHLKRSGETIEVSGEVGMDDLRSCFRMDDDLGSIYDSIKKDERMRELVEKYEGLRLVRQDPWGCSVSFILATCANIPRIRRMIETLCVEFGDLLPGGRYTFPSPQDIVDDGKRLKECGLGFRADRVLEFSQRVCDGEVDFELLREMGYRECVRTLKRHNGIGDKVADCIALFSLDHLEAFPVDVRIKNALHSEYGVESYREAREFGRDYFGRYAGYAQQLIYLSQGSGIQRKPVIDQD